MRPKPLPAGPGQESVWDYPRPPRLEQTPKHLQVVFAGQVIADTRRGWRVLETSHPPVYYFPPEDIRMEYLVRSPRSSFCEWKGSAGYYSVRVGDQMARDAAWFYPAPTGHFGPIRDHVAFYVAAMEACHVDGHLVEPQPGGFYGGWITPELVGPFKGIPGSAGW